MRTIATSIFYLLTFAITALADYTNYDGYSPPYNPAYFVYEPDPINIDFSPGTPGWYYIVPSTNTFTGGWTPQPYDLWLQLTNYQVVPHFIFSPGGMVTNYISQITIVYHGVVQGATYTVDTTQDLTNPSAWHSVYSFVADTNNPVETFTYDQSNPMYQTGFFRLYGPPLPRYSETDWQTAFASVLGDSSIQTSFDYGAYSGAVMVAGMFCFTMLRTISDSDHEEL
jgi:hypothetical protein